MLNPALAGTILHSGRIATHEPGRPFVPATAGGRVIAAGSLDDVQQRRAASTRMIDGPGQWPLDHVLHIAPATPETLGAVGLGVLSGAATFSVLRRLPAGPGVTTREQASLGNPQAKTQR